MTDLLFDTPWWLPALVAAVGVVLFVTGNNRLERRVKAAGLAVVGLAVLLTAVSYFVDTPVETAERRSQELVDAFERADWPAMRAILDPTAALTFGDRAIYGSRDQILTNAEDAHARFGFKSVDVLSKNTEQADTVIKVGLVLLSQQEALGQPFKSEWQFQFQRTADGWALVEVRAISIGNATGGQAAGMFPNK
ncbi:MAG: hypothetical protein AVDCRST_MAG64-1346 [uncultured Phycisphaerae bacterium]|uniref:DUF4440 domain-containing protein n=1 Tax=uncultured Phycisphaerae bacterium TaxID=904963 RepID=A0A6J4NN26_9BACT|nr:MAG: hypothetical protein AVDCRST_MAG64-1346 [uncultured Phycisphaerae bacterium]